MLCLDGRESVGHGFYQSDGDQKEHLASIYEDPYLDQFLEFLRREYQLQAEEEFGDTLSSVGVGGDFIIF